MKFIISIILVSLVFFVTFAGNVFIDPDEDNYTRDYSKVLNTNIDDPIKEGADSAIAGVNGLEKDYKDQDSTLNYIAKWINYFLGLLGLITIIFIIKDGIVIITAKGDDNKQKEAMKNVKNYIIALIMIGISYLIVNFVIKFVVVNS